MTPHQQQLWTRLEQFRFDEPGTALTFAQRLARENGWNPTYALRVLEEYKKFLFLCCITGTGVTPSDPVDQAWHLHLTYTRSYWNDLCRHTLEREIHHNPTRGGSEEQDKFNGFYETTHALYRESFGTEPPPDIWHDGRTRFTDVHFERVNRGRYWIVRKPSARRKKEAALAAICGTALLSIQATFDFSEVEILALAAFLGLLLFIKRGKGGYGSGGTTSSCSGSISYDSHQSNDSHQNTESYQSNDSYHSSDSHQSSDSTGSGCSSSGCSSGCGGGGGGD